MLNTRWLSFGERTEHPGALRADIRPVGDEVADIRALPYRDGQFEGVECFHVLEHLLPGEAVEAVEELHRVLEDGGVLEVAVPDLISCAEALLRGDVEILMNIYSPSVEAAQQHRWGYTRETLVQLVTGAGFHSLEYLPPHPRDPHEIRLRARK